MFLILIAPLIGLCASSTCEKSTVPCGAYFGEVSPAVMLEMRVYSASELSFGMFLGGFIEPDSDDPQYCPMFVQLPRAEFRVDPRTNAVTFTEVLSSPGSITLLGNTTTLDVTNLTDMYAYVKKHLPSHFDAALGPMFSGSFVDGKFNCIQLLDLTYSGDERVNWAEKIRPILEDNKIVLTESTGLKALASAVSAVVITTTVAPVSSETMSLLADKKATVLPENMAVSNVTTKSSSGVLHTATGMIVACWCVLALR